MEENKIISIGEEIGLDPAAPKTDPPAGGDPPKTDPPKTDPPADPPPVDPPAVEGFDNIFQEDIKQYNEEFALPEGYEKLSDAEKYKVIKDSIITNAPKPESGDPFVDSYMKSKELGLSKEEFIKQQNMTEMVKTMSDRDFLIQDYLREGGKTEENPEGWTREQVEEHIDSLNPIALKREATARKDEVLKDVDNQNQEYQETLKTKVKEEAVKINETVIPDTVDKLFTKMSDVKDIGGIPHTPQDQTEFKQMFTDAVSINPETGYSRTRELFSNDEVLYKALFLYSKIQEGENSLKNFLSTFKEEYKQQILDKTRLAPRKEDGSFHTVSVPGADTFV